MRGLMKVIAPVLFWVSYRLFRASLAKTSLKKHLFLMKLFRFAADNHSIKALSVYGHLLHFRGEGIQNRIQGAIYIQRAADRGDVKSQYQMGKIYEQGFEHHFTVDFVKALHYYQQAAKQHHPLAAKRMIDAYQQGDLGVEVDEQQVSFWKQYQPSLV